MSLPAFGAVGGMLVPGLIYAWINWNDPVALQGWAIPAATDIAFALAILALLGDRVPVALKVLLTSIAIFDDVGAIIIIALFYTNQLSVTALLIALACLPVLYFLNRRGVVDTSRYVLIGLIMWVALLKSGVHATLTGVLLALFIPMKDPKEPGTFAGHGSGARSAHGRGLRRAARVRIRQCRYRSQRRVDGVRVPSGAAGHHRRPVPGQTDRRMDLLSSRRNAGALPTAPGISTGG